jgi:hypothetical protein
MALDVFGDMFQNEEMNNTKILNDLMTTKNINVKTRINEPVIIALFDTCAMRFRNKKMKKCANLIEYFSQDWKEVMISYPNGEGRKEITSAIAGIKEQAKNVSTLEKLMGMRRE